MGAADSLFLAPPLLPLLSHPRQAPSFRPYIASLFPSLIHLFLREGTLAWRSVFFPTGPRKVGDPLPRTCPLAIVVVALFDLLGESNSLSVKIP